MKFLADDLVPTIFGQVTPPPGMNIGGTNPVEGFGKIIGFGINVFIMIAGMFMLIYLLWGAFDWITSNGEKERIAKAQNKITNAVVGMLLVFAVLTIFNAFVGKMLGIVNPTSNGFDIILPTLK
jgi:magnesium-transporting ATPase (P-type)